MEKLLKELKERGVKKVALKFFWSRARKESYVELLPREAGEDLPYALEREVRAKLEESLKDLYAERRGCEVEGEPLGQGLLAEHGGPRVRVRVPCGGLLGTP